MGVALGISSARLDGLAKGQKLAEVVVSMYQNCGDGCKEVSWNELKQVLVAAGHSELANSIEVNRSGLVQ